MGHLGVITHRYDSISDLSREINDAVITLKKCHYHLSGRRNLSLEDEERSRETLVNLLLRLRRALAQEDSLPEEYALPPAFVNNVRFANRSSLPYFLEDLQMTISHLQSGKNYTDKDIELLDSLSAIIDTETSRLFRKFWH